ncbi:MAG: TIM barrel protein [Rhodospirillaceae bacterium]|nr:TIM barrel protein [Rhodospirillaceae bacterium]
MDFLVHLSGVCRDLGGRTLIYGGGRKRGDVSAAAALVEAIEFFGELCPRIEAHGTIFCLEPLGPNDTDFIHRVGESSAIVEAVDHPALKVQIDAKALVANDELRAETFDSAKPLLVHVHANEPDLGILGTSGLVDHAAIGGHLRSIGYDGTVSIEQKMINADAPLGAVRQSAAILKECY